MAKKKLSEDVVVEALGIILPLGMYKGQKSILPRSRYHGFKSELKLIEDYGQGGSDTDMATEPDSDNGDSNRSDLQESGESS
jgi:hypothetical protein